MISGFEDLSRRLEEAMQPRGDVLYAGPFARPRDPLHFWITVNQGYCGGCETCGSSQEMMYCVLCGAEDFPWGYSNEHCYAWCVVRLDIYLQGLRSMLSEVEAYEVGR